MTIPETKLYPRTGDTNTIYLQHAVTSPQIKVGAYTMYHEFAYDPRLFETNNVLYQYPINRDRLIIGKFCSIASGVRFLFNSANHALGSLSTYPFPLFFEQWGLPAGQVTQAWDNKGDIVVGNDVWIGYQAVVLSGVKIGDGAIIGARAVVTTDVPPYTIVCGVPAGPIRKRFDDDTIRRLQAVRWWDWEPERIRRYIGALRAGRPRELGEARRGIENQRPPIGGRFPFARRIGRSGKAGPKISKNCCLCRLCTILS